MKDWPAIGGARGIFEIFVPGVFLLFNLFGPIHLFPWMGPGVVSGLHSIASNTRVAILMVICFGYLCGVILRLERADMADHLSAYWHRRFKRRAKRDPAISTETNEP